MSSLRTLVFFATPAHDCSYLPDREATTMFVDPRANIDKSCTANSHHWAFGVVDPIIIGPIAKHATPAFRYG